MRVLVTGSRHLVKEKHGRAILAKLRTFPAGSVLIHGDCEGADRIAAAAAKHLCWSVEPYPANWNKHGIAAGPIRNQRMLDVGQPDVVVAFHTDPKLGRGTADMVRRARADWWASVEVVIL